MKLPTPKTPSYSLTVPSTKAKVTYRPFLVGEEKILMIASETGDPVALVNAIGEIIESCTFGKLKSKDLTSFDIEWIFLQLRSKSVGETTDIAIPCEHCDADIELKVDLNDVKISEVKPLPEKIMLDDTIGIIPRWLSEADSRAFAAIGEGHPEKLVNQMVKSVVKSIFDDEDVYDIADCSDEEIDTFVSSLSREQIEKIEKLMSDMPKVTYDTKAHCIKCKKKTNVHIEGAQSFF